MQREIDIVENVALAVEGVDIVDRQQRVDTGGGFSRARGNLGGAGTDIDFLHPCTGSSFVDGAVEQDPAFVHDRDMIRQLKHPVDVVLDQQHWQIRRDALDNGTDPLALRRGKPRQRFVQQQHARCGGERHAHVEKALATIGQVARFGLFNARETEIADGSVGFGIDRVDRQGIGDRIEAARMPRLHGETDVFANAERRKKVGNLERAADACSGDLLRCMSGDRLAHQGYRALVRLIHTRQEIERRGLAGAIWADQRM